MRRDRFRASKRAYAASLIAIGMFIGTAGCTGRGGQVAEAAPTAGSILQTGSLRLLDLDDKAFDLRKSSEGRVHVVVFTRSDCPVSNRFAPEVRGLFEKFHPQGVDFYLIYVDPNEKPAEAGWIANLRSG